MSALFSNIVFLNPWILSGLLALPALWFLLRVTPPAPKHLRFPAVRFLAGLVPQQQTSSHTPWWILLLRLFIAGLVILALARPVHNPAATLQGSGALRLVMDNGWESAQNWDRQIKEATELITQAGREGRSLYLVTTAPAPGQTLPDSYGPLGHTEALSRLKGLKPLPWPSDYKALNTALEKSPEKEKIHSLLLSAGLSGAHWKTMLSTLQAQGETNLIVPAPENSPLLLGLGEGLHQKPEVTLLAPAGSPDHRPVTVQALSENGSVLDQKTIALSPADSPLTVTFDSPEILREKISRFKLAAHSGAGGLFILDARFHKRPVGIVGPEDEADTTPFIEANYYLKRALEPYTNLHIDKIQDLLKQDLSVIILPDIAAMPPETLDRLEKWVRAGGLLLRFAGPHMAQAQNELFLTPVPLRAGGRSLEGSLSWDNPLGIQPFPKSSPLYGLSVDKDIKVRRQILADPSPDLKEKSWALLEDGTPLITASPLDNGLLVMIHTTAAPDWSNLALSGLYVSILRRIIDLSGSRQTAPLDQTGELNPLWVLDGFGAIQSPGSTVSSIEAVNFSQTIPGSKNPPGLYGRGGIERALNLGGNIQNLNGIPDSLPSGISSRFYGKDYERALMPPLLYTALLLLLVDWGVMSLLISGFPYALRRAAYLVPLLLFAAPAVQAQDLSRDMKYADGLYLAYIQTGDSTLDSTSRAGLEALAKALKRRTSAEPDGVAALDPAHDTLAFFPLIYWPISPQQPPLSAEALSNIQSYLDHGGTILFDTRDQNTAGIALKGTVNAEKLRGMVSALNIPPLAPISENHVLGKSFYLMRSFPGRYKSGTLWVEAADTGGRDGVSPVIIGSHDWAAAWAASEGNSGYGRSAQQEEMALRFGINLVMYALTGNYKADQVHVPHILERLGR